MPSKRRGIIDNDEFEQRKQERQAAVMMKVQDLSPDETLAYLDTVCAKWKLDESHDQSFADAVSLAFSNFNLDLHADINTGDMGSFGLRALDESIHDSEMEMIGLFNQLQEHKLLENAQTLRRIMTCMEHVYYYKRLVLNAFQGKLSAHQYKTTLLPDGSNPFELDKDLDARLGSWMLRFRWIDDDTAPFQKLLLFMLERAMERRYRRQGDYCFEPVIVDGHNTHAWRSVMTIREWIHMECRKETNWEQWLWLTANSNNAKAVEQFLTNCSDYSFPDLVKDRSTFSFLNGVYRAHENKFYPHENSALSNSIAACKFFNQDFPEEYIDVPAADIPSPHLDTIMDYQEWTPEVKRWMYIFLGRLLYNLNDRDEWQVIPFMVGAASSGKCFWRGTRVFLSDLSMSKVEDIKVGDMVLGDDGAPRRVLELARGWDEMYEVTFPWGSFRCTGEHVLCLKYSNQGWTAKWKHKCASGTVKHYGYAVHYWDKDLNKERQKKFTLANAESMKEFVASVKKDCLVEMTVHQYLALKPWEQKYMTMYQPDRMEFEDCVDAAFDPYVFGVWLGDGHSIGARFTCFDKEIVDAVRENIPANLAVSTHTNRSRGVYGIVCRNGDKKNEFMEFLRAYNLVNNKHIPQACFKWSVRDRLELLAGLLDTDGHNKGVGYEIIQKRQDLAEGIRTLCISLGFRAIMKPCEKSCMHKGEKRTGTYYRIHIAGDGVEDIPCRLPRKRVEQKTRRRNSTVHGFSIRKVEGTHEYFGFQIDGNQRFCLANGIVTHNSTVTLKVAKQFYEDIDVGCMSNNIETKFGLSQFHEKLLFVAPEIKSDLKIEQAEFQSLVSGEDISINQKYKTAFSTQWKVPGILAGNEVPQWCDNSGSIQRRLVVFTFGKQVTHGDMKLGDKLRAELPVLLLKCNKMYLETVKDHESTNIWTILPEYFLGTRNELAQTTNALEAFVNSEEVLLDREAYVTFEDFKASLRNYTTHNNLGTKRMTWEYFRDVFERYHITKSRTQMMYNNRRVLKDFLFGVALTKTNDNDRIA